jgi:zona occludens toxin
MIVFNEGLPRSGKSYDAVLSHILPALKSGRHVFARLNGLNHQLIAEYLGLEVERVLSLLTLVSTAEVKSLFVAVRPDPVQVQQDADLLRVGVVSSRGEWTIPDRLKNALFVIDECHEFYVASREAINPAVENFFALCGQNGMDGVLLSQWYKRLHSSLRARIERKNVFQKLTAVGMEKKYTVKRFHATGPDQFELVTTDTATYLPAIFPLYKGYADGATNTEVYKAGGQTVWRKLGKYAIFVVPLVIFAIYQFTTFFGPHSGLAKQGSHLETTRQAQATTLATGDVLPHAASEAVVIEHHGKMGVDQAYVFDLSDKARPRLAGLVSMPGHEAMGVIEWRQDQGTVLERLNLSQIRDLGVTVEVHGYGVKLIVGKDSRVVTAWPLDVPTAPPAGDQVAQVDQAQGKLAADAVESSKWHKRAIPTEYTPPELVQGPGPSTFTMKN